MAAIYEHPSGLWVVVDKALHDEITYVARDVDRDLADDVVASHNQVVRDKMEVDV